MNSGYYSAVNGAMRAEMRLDQLSNNLANVNTTGYKQDSIAFESYMTSPGPEQFPLPTDSFLTPLGLGQIPFPFSSPATNAYPMSYPKAALTRPDLTQGPMHLTSRYQDVAIDGKGYFMINTPNGVRYTRDGGFQVNNNGELVTNDGFHVLGEGESPIIVGRESFEIGGDGIISNSAGVLGRLIRVDFPVDALEKEGHNLYKAAIDQRIPMEGAAGGFLNGFLEGSNTNMVYGMSEMVETHRLFNYYMEMVKTLDRLDEQAVTSIGQIQG